MIVGTLVKLALCVMPHPLRSFNAWPKKAKREVHKRFWARYNLRKAPDNEDEEEHMAKTLEVMDKITNKGYMAALRRERKNCQKALGNNTHNWKMRMPAWCTNTAHWDSLCDEWGTKHWIALSNKNRDNRTRTNRLVTHYAGSCSAYKHHKRLSAKLKREATWEELYLELHVPKKYRISEAPADVPEGSDGDGTGESSAITTSMTAMHIFDPKAKAIYDKVKEMELNPENADKQQEELWLMASGGPSHGKKFGFGSKLDNITMPTADYRARATPSLSESASTVTQQNKGTYTAEEVAAMMEDKDRQFREECERIRECQEHNQLLFARLFQAMGQTMPNFQGPMPSGVASGVNTGGELATQMPNQSSMEMGLDLWFQNSGVDPSVLNYTG